MATPMMRNAIDASASVAMGYLLSPGPGTPASASLPYTDGVLVEDSQFDNYFPFLTTSIPGSPNGKKGIDANGTSAQSARHDPVVGAD
jgi:hypothetical protein